MKTLKLFTVLSLVGFMSQGCQKNNCWGIKGQGPLVHETRAVIPFDRIDMQIDGELTIVQDSVYRMEVTGQANILSVLETRVFGGELKISFAKNVWSHKTVKIVVHAPVIRALALGGSGFISASELKSETNLDLNIGGSGQIKINSLRCSYLSANIGGSGSIRISGGVVDSENFLVSGSGSINSEWVNCKTNSTQVSGSGNVVTNVAEGLSVIISGSGCVKYRGYPGVNSQISGSGRLIHID